MNKTKYVYGPVPSRRLGLSLGISPIPKKTCNYSCIYCQLGRTDRMTNTRQMFFAVDDIISEFYKVLSSSIRFDVVTIVGEGEPTLYLGLGELIDKIHIRTDKPVAVITNGALLYNDQLQNDIGKADIILPTLDAYDEESFKNINRPHGSLDFIQVKKGLEKFSSKYQGQLWIEIMLMKDINDDIGNFNKYTEMLSHIKYDKLYLNTPVRPPAELGISTVNHKNMNNAADLLNGISIDLLESQGFQSEIKDNYEAVLSIIKRHPMNQYEIKEFLKSRDCINIKELINRLLQDDNLSIINYKGYDTYRFK